LGRLGGLELGHRFGLRFRLRLGLGGRNEGFGLGGRNNRFELRLSLCDYGFGLGFQLRFSLRDYGFGLLDHRFGLGFHLGFGFHL
jgi:hypothetical protein